jgi:soluble epoxide hydrolase / lipid-phosphate phosphatase
MGFSVLRLFSILPLVLGATRSVCNTTAELEVKQLTTADGTSYVYDYIPAASDKSTVLLLHGFPGTRSDWKHQVKALSAEGYGIIAPDLLGYGETDRPTDLAAYRLKRMSEHLAEILDHHELTTVVGVGHDWGTMVLSKSLYWHSERYEKAAFVSTGYVPVGTFWDVDTANVLSFKDFGYYQYGYWYFFNSYNAKDLIADRVRCHITMTSWMKVDRPMSLA